MNGIFFLSDAAVMYGTNLENQMQDTCGCPLMTDTVDFVISFMFLIFLFLSLGFLHLFIAHTHTLLDWSAVSAEVSGNFANDFWGTEISYQWMKHFHIWGIKQFHAL